MPTRENCPNCSAVYKIRTGIGRKQIHCQRCKQYFVINDHDWSALPVAPTSDARPAAAPPGEPAPQSRRGRLRLAIHLGLVAGLFLSLGTIAIVEVVSASLTDTTQARLEAPAAAPPSPSATVPTSKPTPVTSAKASTPAAAPTTPAKEVRPVVPAPPTRPAAQPKVEPVRPATVVAPSTRPVVPPPPPVVVAPPPAPPVQPPVVVAPPPAPPMQPPVAVAPPQPVAPNGQLLPDVLRRVKRATVLVRVWLPPDDKLATGTGFFGAEPGIVLTNAHVLGMLGADSLRPTKIELVLNSGEANEHKLAGHIVGIDRTSDLAVLAATSTSTPAVALPPPLPVLTATNLLETQEVFVFGFPLGEQLGREITVRKSSVASLRKENGVLTRVQVNGGMDPGNSGGPVIDAAGSVVGVAVSGIRNTQINFAIPGDHVHILLNGRLLGLSMDHPFLKDGKVRAGVAAEKIDPLRRLKSATLELWTGNAGEPRPGGAAAPAARPGDAARQTVALDHNREPNAIGEVALPDLPSGKVYWLQASWLDGLGARHWGVATPFASTSPPVERKPATLAYRYKVGTRPVHVSQRATLRPEGRGMEGKFLNIATDLKLTEQTLNVDGQGTAEIRQECKTLSLTAVLDGKPMPLGKRGETLTQNIAKSAMISKINRTGQVTQATIDLGKVPPDARDDVRQLHEELKNQLTTLSVPLPANAQVSPLTTWKALRVLPIETPTGSELGAVEVVYTLLGTRSRNGREEAVVGMKGVLRSAENSFVEIAGRLEGTAVFDLAAGQISAVDTQTKLELSRAGAAAVQAKCVMDVKLQRTLEK